MAVVVGEQAASFGSYFAPCPEEDIGRTLDYLLHCNVRIRPYGFLVGAEAAFELRASEDTASATREAIDANLVRPGRTSILIFPSR